MTFEEITDGAFSNDELNIIEASARFTKWYKFADDNFEVLIGHLSSNGVPAVIMLQVFEDNARLLREAIEEADDDD